MVTALLPISKDKIIILIDNGIATDATMRVAIKLLQELDCQRLIIATPVAPESTIQELSAEMDEVVLPRTPEPFSLLAIGIKHFFRLLTKKSKPYRQKQTQNRQIRRFSH
ncbi:phosphoribosyltransferase family protein [Candidatus Coxiella mudrowiae]|uniref:phosphoribosyltransferase family protein n=1 Tax=Candidatus Coxiella mudrowiae TaxID=2054173 RepID=UPI001F1F9DC0|nr:phosphoribosyltransferase family protein [Candidatus Coxiella mudrowiae]